VIKCRSYAKVNLYLQVGSLREDGFHRVQTIMQAIGLSDELCFEPGESGISISAESACDYLPPPGGNLISQAYEAVCRHTGVRRAVKVSLSKKIPVGGGLGGGSSNACTTIKALDEMWSLGLSEAEMLSIASSIGSDVPFFLYGGSAYAEGRGEILTLLDDIEPLHIVLVRPPFAISTADAYRWLDEMEREITPEPLPPPDPKNAPLFNSFEEALFPRFPVLRTIKEALVDGGCSGAMLSGSGSVVFGVAGSEERALSAAGAMRERCLGEVFVTATERRKPFA